MNGILIINKPCYKTSHDMVNFVRRLTGIKKVGHTGTLDPMATGVLPVCIGNATKACDLIMSQKKAYRVEMMLGMTTDTLDAEGEILTDQPVLCSEEEIKKTIYGFIGEVWQIPPMYSAIKKDGKKLYELAREGKVVERQKRKIEIYDINIEKIDKQKDTVSFLVECSKGTYVRTLCEDIGIKLGCGAFMSRLERVRSGEFTIENAITTEELTKIFEEDRLCDYLISVDELFLKYPKVIVNQRQKEFIINGVRVRYFNLCEGQTYRVYDMEDNFLCLSKCTDERLTLEKAFWKQ